MPVESWWDVLIDIGLAWGLPFTLFVIWYFTINKYIRIRDRALDIEEEKLRLHRAVLNAKGIKEY